VASLGTALTPEQVKLLARFARKVVVNYDGDNAGVQAAKKAIEILLAEDLEVKILVLPDDSDPDEFIRKSGVGEYQRQRGEAQPHIQFVIDQAVRDRKLSNPADKEAAIDEVLPYIRAVRSRIQKREYFDIAMDSLRVGDAALRRELWHSIRTGMREAATVVQSPNKQTHVKPTQTEERLLKLLFSDAELCRVILPKLEREDYQGLLTEKIFQALLEIEAEGKDLSDIREKMEGDEIAADLLPMLLMWEPSFSDPGDFDRRILLAEGCIDGLRRIRIESRIDSLKEELSDAARIGDTERYSVLSTEQIELMRRRNQLMLGAEARRYVNEGVELDS
jgi:DNA primase